MTKITWSAARRAAAPLATALALAGPAPFGAALAQEAGPEVAAEAGAAAPSWDAFAYRTVEANGVRLAYREAGESADGEEAVVLLHGWPQHSLMWHAIAPRLAQAGHRVIAPDLRGSGGSTVTEGGYDKATMAVDVLALMDALGVETAHVVGYDLGAGVAYDLAARHPERVASMAFMEFGLPGFGYEEEMTPRPDWTPGSNWHLGLFTVPDVAVWAFAGQERKLLSWFFGHIAADPFAVSPAHFEEYARNLERPGALRAGVSYYAAVWEDAEANRRLAETPLAMPVLGVGGEASGGPYIAQGLEAVASDVSAAVIPGAGHWLGDENPQAVSDALLSFFEGQGT